MERLASVKTNEQRVRGRPVNWGVKMFAPADQI